MTENILNQLNLIILDKRSQQTEWKLFLVVQLLFAMSLTVWKSILQLLVKLEYWKWWIWTEWFWYLYSGKPLREEQEQGVAIAFNMQL